MRVRPGSLFIVGDPKQSIYRFRRADIDTYNEIKGIIRASGGRIVNLTANFRSVPAVCDWVNSVFEHKLPAEASQYQPAFERLDPFRKLKGGGVKRITIAKVDWHSQQEVARQDAERIASWIGWALEGNFRVSRSEEETKEGKSPVPSPGDFMLILRYRAHLPIYARALEARGIPYEVSGGAAFSESQELRDLLNLLTAILDIVRILLKMIIMVI